MAFCDIVATKVRQIILEKLRRGPYGDDLAQTLNKILKHYAIYLSDVQVKIFKKLQRVRLLKMIFEG